MTSSEVDGTTVMGLFMVIVQTMVMVYWISSVLQPITSNMLGNPYIPQTSIYLILIPDYNQ